MNQAEFYLEDLKSKFSKIDPTKIDYWMHIPPLPERKD